MIAFWICFGILFFISALIFVICISTLEIEIKKFNFHCRDIKTIETNEFLIYVKLKILNKFTLIKIKINNDVINKIKIHKLKNDKKRFNKLKTLIARNKKEILSINNIKKLEITINNINLEIRVGLLDNMITSFIIVIISTIISMIISRTICNYTNEICKYKIEPIYNNDIQIIIKLNCIINVKMVHIINIIYMLLKKECKI